MTIIETTTFLAHQQNQKEMSTIFEIHLNVTTKLNPNQRKLKVKTKHN